MGESMDDTVKCWTANRKAALVNAIIQGKTTVAQGRRTYDPQPNEIEGWVDDAKKKMKNSPRATLRDFKD